MKNAPKFIKSIINIVYILLLVGKKKIFCLSMQRNGTTSCGRFLKDHGFRVAGYGEHSVDWSYQWLNGNYSKIFNSLNFKGHQAFEDNPWWSPDFYRVIFHKFPKSKFILFTRDSDKWYDSMLKHSNGKILGNTYRHCKVYNRLDEYYDKLENDPEFKPSDKEIDNLMDMTNMREHYTKIYDLYNREVVEFFNKVAPGQLFVCQLEDDHKWTKLGRFLRIKVNDDYNIHLGKSK